jgi:Protein of unknown function DUF262/Protein of unknown function (DUF1524)
MQEIRGEAKTIRQLLSGQRYTIDYYQREYRWEAKQLQELIDDLTGKFLDDHQPADERSAVQGYGHYFLGSIILSRKNNESFIIDGQQRLTTLTLLLVYLHNRQFEIENPVKLDELIYSEKYGKKSFNIDVDERRRCMDALFSGADFDASDKSESVRNMAARFAEIDSFFPADIEDAALPYFADWLIENVHLVEITAYSDDDAYTIFETMNDRGLSLTPLDMLKGYVLANISDEQERLRAGATWKSRVAALAELGKDEDADAVKAWLRSQYALTIRERKKGAQPGDFDRLGTEFHRWVKEHDDQLGLTGSSSFAQFVERDLSFYTRQYERLRLASRSLTPGLEVVFYNARMEFTLQYAMLLAPLEPSDDDATIDAKIGAVGTYVDIMLARRLWNFRSIAYSTMQYASFLAIRDVRRKTVEELNVLLRGRLDAEDETFAVNERMHLHGQNRPAVRYLLARMTDHLERAAGLPSRFAEYMADGKQRHEVEHIWANHFDRHRDEFSHPTDFQDYRNRIGGLLLLPKSFNASYGDVTYEEKLPHYLGQNLLAKSLHPDCYSHNPGFLAYVSRSGLPFKAHPAFKRHDLDERQRLYVELAEEVWNPDRLSAALSEPSAAAEADG